MLKWIWFFCGLLAGLTALSITKASVPTRSQLTDDTAIYQRVSEIRVKKELQVDFDSSLNALHAKEKKSQYHEKLPTLSDSPRLKGPVERVSRQRYR